MRAYDYFIILKCVIMILMCVYAYAIYTTTTGVELKLYSRSRVLRTQSPAAEPQVLSRFLRSRTAEAEVLSDRTYYE